MSFQTSCMVLVKDEQQQIELEKWMKSIGWQVYLGKDGPCSIMANTNHGQALWMHLEGQHTRKKFARDFIDCGENIEMFKALAAMNDENDREQLFIDSRARGSQVSVIKCTHDNIEEYRQTLGYPEGVCHVFHKMTIDEITKHFRLKDMSPEDLVEYFKSKE